MVFHLKMLVQEVKKSTSDSYRRAKFAFAGFRLWISDSLDGLLLISRMSKSSFIPFFTGAAAGKRCNPLCKPPQSCKISTSTGLFHCCWANFPYCHTFIWFSSSSLHLKVSPGIFTWMIWPIFALYSLYSWQNICKPHSAGLSKPHRTDSYR